MITTYFYFADYYKITLENFAVLITNEVAAVVLEEANKHILRTIKEISMKDFEKEKGMATGIYLDETLQEQLKQNSTKLILTFFLKNVLFNDPLTNISSIAGNVVGIILSNATIKPQGSFWYYSIITVAY